MVCFYCLCLFVHKVTEKGTNIISRVVRGVVVYYRYSYRQPRIKHRSGRRLESLMSVLQAVICNVFVVLQASCSG